MVRRAVRAAGAAAPSLRPQVHTEDAAGAEPDRDGFADVGMSTWYSFVVARRMSPDTRSHSNACTTRGSAYPATLDGDKGT